ncbi:MAG: PmoA family protein [Akkermansiaceae bacterium]|nr:PmoA family protein [Akkermansiaceae bacterium]
MPDYTIPRCEIVPLADRQTSLRVGGEEKTRWHFGADYPRPFFFPCNGPSSGASLTRIGHPGAQNHDHHRSVWFAHAKVNGLDFWSENGKTRIREKLWLRYRDGDEEALLASLLGWFDPEGREVLEQEMVAALIPGDAGEWFLETQSIFRPPKGGEAVTLEVSNFGVFAVRVAKSVSVHFGGGKIVSSEGMEGEPSIFGQSARWMDYSGPMAKMEKDGQRVAVTEGITYFDHPGNPRYPAHWHVREDGWMGASLCRNEPVPVTAEAPVTVRYLLHFHRGGADLARSEAVAAAFAERPGFVVEEATVKHQQYEARRAG